MNRRPDMSTHGKPPFSSIARGRLWLDEIVVEKAGMVYIDI
jgi:hypothetical protein